MKKSLLLILLLLVTVTFGQAQNKKLEIYIQKTDTIMEEGVVINVSSDDAEQENDEMDDLFDDDLDIGYEYVDASEINIVNLGMRFLGITIPTGATIDSAFIVVHSHEGKSATDEANITIRGEKNANPETFSMEALITDRPKTSASVRWEVAKLVPISFSEPQLKNLKIALEPSTQEIGQIDVTALARGQQKALLDQKLAENIKNIVSSEQIEKFPDMNAAEVIQRIPGITLQRDQGEGRFVQLRGTPPELTNFNINGEQIPSPEGDARYVGLDVISADQIEIVKITKVLTPDMDADGIGGNVNIITKKVLDQKPDISAAISGGYNNLRQTENYQMQFSYGARFGKFGFHLNSSYYQINLGSDNMEFDYIKGPFWGSQSDSIGNYKVQYKKMELRHYDITRTRIGVSTTMDYIFNEGSSVYLRGMFNSFTDQELRRRKTYETSDAISETFYLDCSVAHDIRDTRQKYLTATEV